MVPGINVDNLLIICMILKCDVSAYQIYDEVQNHKLLGVTVKLANKNVKLTRLNKNLLVYNCMSQESKL